MLKRDKVISVRVNKELYDKVNKLISEKTDKHEGRRRIRYMNDLPKEYGGQWGKVSIADIIEVALKEFAEKYSEK